MDLFDILLARANSGGGGGGDDGGGVFILSVDPDTGLFNMTWREIANAALSGKVGFLVVSTSAPEDVQPGDYVVSTWTLWGVYRDENSGAYGVEFSGGNGASLQFYAETADDYPVYD